jgi:N-acetylmuramoyl-L-alanine amidase
MMKKKDMLKLIVACVATFTFIGMQSDLVAAAQIEESNLNGENNDKQEVEAGTDETKVVEMQATRAAIQVPKKSFEHLSDETPAMSLSSGEKDLLSRLVEAEAKGESYEGKVAIATVVLNRVESTQFPNSVTSVIHEVVGNAYAFTPVQNGEINKPASKEAKEAVEEALTRKDRLQNSLFFYNPEIATDDWIRSRTIVKTIGKHAFAV